MVHIYSVNLQTGAMAETLGSPLPNFTSTMNLIADPTGPFIYLENSPIRGFSVDPLTGYFTEIAGSPFSPAGDAALLFSVPPGGQPITGPVATLSASALSFGSINVASTSGPQTITLTSAGGEALSVNTISISGAGVGSGSAPLPLYAALQVGDASALEALSQRPGAARVLLDGPAGGSGKSFAWSLASRARALHPAPLFIAGGLTADNVAQAIREAAPDGVDVASGIEGSDGFKDAAKVRAFVKAARSVSP